MNKLITPEQEFENPNDFYTVEEANRYNSNSGMKKTQKELTQIALELSKPILNNKNINILDIGCGTGFSLEYLRDLGFTNLKGIDPSKEMIKLAKEKNLDVQEAGFENFKKIKETYNLIISISALQWPIANKEHLELKNLVKKIGKELFRLLEHNGVCVIQFYPATEHILEDVISSFKRSNFITELYIHNSDSLKKKKTFLILRKH